METTRMVRAGSIVCAGAAVLCVLAGLAVGQPAGGAVVGLGLLIGAVNPLVVQLLLRLGLNPGATSMTRLGVFTAVVIAAGFAVGVSRAWLLVLGVAAAQMVSAVTAAVEMTRR
ncbi:MAG TPA: hypothetical protein VGL20_09465 [Candidatus Dormibacteraeota bacterium]